MDVCNITNVCIEIRFVSFLQNMGHLSHLYRKWDIYLIYTENGTFISFIQKMGHTHDTQEGFRNNTEYGVLT